MSFQFISLGGLLDTLKGEASQTIFHAAIAADHAIDHDGEVLPRLSFAADEHYFEIVLTQMHLQARREYWREFIPFSLAISEFDQSDGQVTLPFLVGHNLLGSHSDLVKGQMVQFRNTPVAGPLPYVGGDISMFVGLFRMVSVDLSKEFLTFVDNVAGLFDISRITSYIDIGKALNHSLSGLLGMKETELVFGVRNTFSAGRTAASPLLSGYYAIVNCPAERLDKNHLWVIDGELWHGRDRKTAERYRDHDFCLLQIGQRASRDSITTFPFWKLWTEIKLLVREQNRKQAKALMPSLARDVSSCADLTEADKTALLETFYLDFALLVERAADGGKKRAKAAVRDARSGHGDTDAVFQLGRAAEKAELIGAPNEVRQSLRTLNTNLKKYADGGLFGDHEEVTEEALGAQLTAVKSAMSDRANPRQLADFIALDMVSSD